MTAHGAGWRLDGVALAVLEHHRGPWAGPWDMHHGPWGVEAYDGGRSPFDEGVWQAVEGGDG